MKNERVTKTLNNIAETFTKYADDRGFDLKLIAADNAIEFRRYDGSVVCTKTVNVPSEFDPIAFAVEVETEINEIGGDRARARRSARISDLLVAYAKSIVGPNYTIAESIRYMAYAIDDPTGWIGSCAPELLGLDCHYIDIDWIFDKENAAAVGAAAFAETVRGEHNHSADDQLTADPDFCGECLSHYGTHRLTCPTLHVTDWTSAEQRRSALKHFSTDELIAAAIKAVRRNSPATKWNDDETAAIELTANEQIAAAAAKVAERIGEVAERLAIADRVNFDQAPTMFCPVCRQTKPDVGDANCADCVAADIARADDLIDADKPNANPGAAAAERAAGISKAIASGKTAAERRAAAGNDYGEIVERYDD